MDIMIWLKSQRDRVVAWLLIAIGGLCILAGWIGVTNTVQVYNQLTYLVSGAIVGLFFLGVGVALLLSADFHDEWRKLDRIEAVLRGRPLADIERVVDLDAADGGSVPNAAAASSGAPLRDNQSQPVMMASAVPAGAALALPIRREVTWAVPGLVVSVILIAFGWIKSTNSTDAQVGADALLIAVYGVFACGIGVALHSRWLRQSLARRKGRLLGPILALDVDTDDEVAVTTQPPADDGALYVAEHGRRFHRAGCAIVASQKAVPAQAGDVTGLLPCQLCHGAGTTAP
jgi:hypothetical protein